MLAAGTGRAAVGLSAALGLVAARPLYAAVGLPAALRLFAAAGLLATGGLFAGVGPLAAAPVASAPSIAATPAALLFIAVLVVGAPLVSLWDDRVLVDDLAAGRSDARIRAYLRAGVFSWALAIAGVWLWVTLAGTSWAAGAGPPPGPGSGSDTAAASNPGSAALTSLGLGLPADRGDWVLLALGVAFAWLSFRQLRQRTTEVAAPHTAAELRPVAHLLPQRTPEVWAFRGAAVSAGLTEEVVYRGWLLGALTPVLGPWLAVPGAALVSGAAQLHQGPVGLLRGAVFGLVAGTAFALTGNLWGLVVAHVAMDLMGGEMAWGVREQLARTGDGVPKGPPEAYRSSGGGPRSDAATGESEPRAS